jgi:hypothetical protein
MRTTPEKRKKTLEKYNNTPERKAAMAEYYRNNKDKAVNRQMMANYGITLSEYNELLDKQKGLCYICESHHTSQTRRLHIDHCHNSGKIRSLLCVNCNTALGLLKEDSNRVKKMIEYIEEHKI